MVNFQKLLRKFWLWLKLAVPLAVIFCLGLYYLLSAGMKFGLYFRNDQPELRHYNTFNGVWFFATSILFFSSSWLIIKTNKYSPFIFASALISASVMAFNNYKEWVGHEYSWMYSDWVIIGMTIAPLFIWWMRKILKDTKISREETDEKTQLDGDIRWQASDACVCLVCLVLSNIVIASIVVLLNYPWLHSPSGLLVSYIISIFIFLVITIQFSKVKTLQAFKRCFGFIAPKLYTVIGAMLSGAAIAALVVYSVNIKMLTPHNKFAESFGNANIGYFNLLMLLAPFWEEVIIRGYIYKALRQDYSIAVSICCILTITVFSHFSPIFSAPLAVIPLLSLNIIIALFREKTKSIWNCIACHFAYNYICVYGGRLAGL